MRSNHLIGTAVIAHDVWTKSSGKIDPLVGVSLVQNDFEKIKNGDFMGISLTGKILALSVAGIGGFSMRKLQQPLTLGALAIGQPMFAAGAMVGGSLGSSGRKRSGGRRRGRSRGRRRRR